jgi:hypothetical protein
MKTRYTNAIEYLAFHTVVTMGARRWFVPMETLELTASLWDKTVLEVIADIQRVQREAKYNAET